MSKNIIFCNIAWMKLYRGYFIDDVPIGGGSYVGENNDGHENHNFLPCDNGKTYGFIQTKNGTINIGRFDGIQDNDYKAEDITVIWCAKGPIGSVIVGWYDHATVYRNAVDYPLDKGKTSSYHIVCKNKDAHLIEEKNRTFKIPRRSEKGSKFGFGQSNVWYADTKNCEEFKEQVLEYLKSMK